jgi:hypothetical protein
MPQARPSDREQYERWRRTRPDTTDPQPTDRVAAALHDGNPVFVATADTVISLEPFSADEPAVVSQTLPGGVSTPIKAPAREFIRYLIRSTDGNVLSDGYTMYATLCLEADELSFTDVVTRETFADAATGMASGYSSDLATGLATSTRFVARRHREYLDAPVGMIVTVDVRTADGALFTFTQRRDGSKVCIDFERSWAEHEVEPEPIAGARTDDRGLIISLTDGSERVFAPVTETSISFDGLSDSPLSVECNHQLEQIYHHRQRQRTEPGPDFTDGR